MAKWEKLGRIYNPFDFNNRPYWMFEYSLAPCVIVFNETVRVFIGTRPPRDEKGQRITYTGFVDLDKNNLFKIKNISEKPVLELGGPGTFDEFGTYPLSVIQTEINGQNCLCGFYAGWTRCESVPFNVNIGIAISHDNGVSFKKLGPGPVLPYSPFEPFTLSSPKIRKFNDLYYLFYIAGRKWIEINGRQEICHKIRLATSKDCINWEKFGHDLIPNFWSDDEAQASPDVFYMNGRYHMFFCGWIPQNFRTTRSRQIGYAWSNDLFNWNRDDGLAGINPSETGWDSEIVAYPHVFNIDTQIYLMYIGNEVGRLGFGLAKLQGIL